MNFSEMEEDIKSLEQSAKDCIVDSEETFNSAKLFSQSVSHINIWLVKLQKACNDANAIVTRKCDDYIRKNPSSKTQSRPEPESKPTAAPNKPVSEPMASNVASPAPAPKPTISLDDFDEGEISEEDELAVEMQKSLF